MFGFDDPSWILPTAIAIGGFLLIGFPVHEFFHAFAANRLGDGTARLFGRLSLNPAVHFDPLGAGIMIVTAVLSQGSFFVGWAKPTPVNVYNLRGGRHSEAIVAAAGPLSNLLIAAIVAIPLRIVAGANLEIPVVLEQALRIFLAINVLLLVFNLIPIPPLDGSKVMFSLLNPRTVWQIRPFLEQYGMFILIFALFLPIGGASIGERILFPLIDGITNLLLGT